VAFYFGHSGMSIILFSICTTTVWAFCFLLLFFVQAPAEAEAELALMNSMGLIDAILTNDSDVFCSEVWMSCISTSKLLVVHCDTSLKHTLTARIFTRMAAMSQCSE